MSLGCTESVPRTKASCDSKSALSVRTRRRLLHLAVFALMLFGVSCTNRELTRTPRTGTEQLLLSHAIQQSVHKIVFPFSSSAAVAVEVVGFAGDRQWLQPSFLGNSPMVNANSAPPLSTSTSADGTLPTVRPAGSDLAVLQAVLEGRLAEFGCALVPSRERADFWIRVVVFAIGTDQGQNFFGMPPTQSLVIPFSLPAITLYEAQRQIGYVRYLLQVYDARTGKLVSFTPWYEGNSYYNQYTILFFINFRGTDLITAPSLQ